jgi:hypothetical protein
LAQGEQDQPIGQLRDQPAVTHYSGPLLRLVAAEVQLIAQQVVADQVGVVQHIHPGQLVRALQVKVLLEAADRQLVRSVAVVEGLVRLELLALLAQLETAELACQILLLVQQFIMAVVVAVVLVQG